ncbi:MAG: YoaK family protein [Rhizonema sp. PD37]|nr:YoaK family protein [Rhizonema sp. PD37]
MTTVAENQSETWLCLGLAFVGGYADAASYILAGTFTGHITGNSVLAAVSIANGDWLLTISRFLAIGAFLLGTLLSSGVDGLVKRKLSKSELTVALFLEAILIFIAASFGIDFHQALRRELFIIFMSLALGLQNGALSKANGISVHTTYVTGMVTTLLEHEFDLIKSNREHRRRVLPQTLPTDFTFRLLSTMWLAFFLGAGAGGAMGFYFISFTIWGVGFLVLLLALFKLRVSQRVSHNRQRQL